MKLGLHILFVSIVTFSCSGGLNEEQRKQVKKGNENRIIRKISDAQIMAASLQKGEEILQSINNEFDSSLPTYNAIWLYDSLETTNDKFRAIQEAYLYSKENGQPMPSHVEMYSSDSILFAAPARLKDKSGLWFIFLEKKAIIKSIQ